jgi:hypothetical protein
MPRSPATEPIGPLSAFPALRFEIPGWQGSDDWPAMQQQLRVNGSREKKSGQKPRGNGPLHF